MELNRIKGKIAFISGASSGIGKAVAEKLAQMGVNLILCARRAEVLAELKAQLEKEHAIEVITLAFDVRNYQEVAKNIQSLPEKWRQIDILINNAGLAIGLQPLHTYAMEDADQMIDTNIKGFTYIANSVIPLMIATGKVGTIVNVGSVAGEIAYPNGSIYCATKFAVRALSDAMKISPILSPISSICLTKFKSLILPSPHSTNRMPYMYIKKYSLLISSYVKNLRTTIPISIS